MLRVGSLCCLVAEVQVRVCAVRRGEVTERVLIGIEGWDGTRSTVKALKGTKATKNIEAVGMPEITPYLVVPIRMTHLSASQRSRSGFMRAKSRATTVGRRVLVGGAGVSPIRRLR